MATTVEKPQASPDRPMAGNANVAIRALEGSLMLDADRIEQIPWYEEDLLPGSLLKYLHVDLTTGQSAVLLRIMPGVQLPVHVQFSGAYLFCVKGRFTYEAGSIGPGGFGYEPYGVVHEPDSMGEETVLFIVSGNNGLIQFYKPDGSPGAIFHVREALKNARAKHGEPAVAHLDLPAWFWID